MSARLRALVALPALVLSLMTGVVAVGTATAPAADAASRHSRLAHAKNIALHQIGDPYKWGATGPKSFDCSGLVYYSYRHAGFSVPRTAAQQAAHARHIKKSHMRPGDFLFFSDGGGVYHVGIMVGRSHGKPVMVHSPRPGQRVQRAVPWTSHWFAGTLRGR